MTNSRTAVQESTSDQLTTLTRRDLVGFDKIATDLVLEMQLEGWQGYITARGHAMMRHPDGSHQSISRASNRGKSGTAMRARFESWKRRRAEREAHPVFGELPQEPTSLPVPVATLLEMRQSEPVKRYLEDEDSREGDQWVAVGYDDEPRGWAVFDTSNPYPVLVAHGSKTNEQGAWAALMFEEPDLFPEPASTETSDQETTMMASVFVCPEPGCGKQFDTQRKASVHNAASHHRERMDCPVVGCEWNGYKNMLTRHTQVAHEAHMHTCGICGAEFTTSAGLGMHRTRKHNGQVDPPVHVTLIEPADVPVVRGDAPVTSPPGHDVLLEHLEHLPEGADAEAQVAAVRSIVAGPLVAEVRRLREELAIVTKERDKHASDAADFEARLTLMREVMGV